MGLGLKGGEKRLKGGYERAIWPFGRKPPKTWLREFLQKEISWRKEGLLKEGGSSGEGFLGRKGPLRGLYGGLKNGGGGFFWATF